MAEFIRARSAEQKEQRLNEIKDAVRRQFAERPYHEITLTTIAEELGWSRANLYKYVTTKEEIFLLLTADECRGYFDALLAALPEGCDLTPATIAEVWAGIANAHQEYFRLGDLLATIVETNVTVERLMDFKRGYYDCVAAMRERLPRILNIAPERVEPLLLAIYYHATGIVSSCWSNPLIAEALTRLEIERPETDFRAEMGDFIGMCLEHYAQGA
ncbi:TetR family transcriptional regulator [Thermophilibacter provencensis]|uniref:TetR family transcriptional regulator n=1 Tax=Thermophilibacter provencensis TaxID=1852386 RepID=A0ABT7V427_9ACTN|nr:TetR family transcriptional regulator [Thermophilibacter provencensis]MDM8271343.1 TetR family transcriptional regulator [Thermophilibacter provencensis]